MTDKKSELKPVAVVSAMRTDRDVALTLEKVIATLSSLQSEFASGGIAQEFLALTLLVLQCVRSGRTDKQAEDAADSLGLFLIDLAACLTTTPFENPHVEGVTALGKELLQLRTDLKELAVSKAQVANELQSRNAAFDSLSQLAGQQTGKIHELEARLASATETNFDRLNRLEPTLAGIARGLGEKLESAKHRESLLRQLSQVHEEQAVQVSRDVERVAELVVSIQQVVANVKAQVNPVEVVQYAPQEPPAAESDLDVAKEIGRRQEWLLQVGERIEETSSACSDIGHELSRVSSELGLAKGPARAPLVIQQTKLTQQKGQLEALQQKLLDSEKGVQEQIRKLRAYKAAQELVASGLDQQAMLAGLPEIPDTTEAEPEQQQEAGHDADLNKIQALAGLAAAHGVSTKALFMITLYECLPQRPTGGVLRKSSLRIARVARDCGLLSEFGFGREIRQIVYLKQDEAFPKAFMHYGGTPGGIAIYSRTANPLSWKVTDVFSGEEVSRFLAQYVQNEQKAEERS